MLLVFNVIIPHSNPQKSAPICEYPAECNKENTTEEIISAIILLQLSFNFTNKIPLNKISSIIGESRRASR